MERLTFSLRHATEKCEKYWKKKWICYLNHHYVHILFGGLFYFRLDGFT